MTVRTQDRKKVPSAHKFPNLSEGFSERETPIPPHVADTFAIDEISLIARNGQKISLGEVMISFEIFEDIFNPNISGFVELADYVGGLEKLQLTGGEKLSVKILKPNSTNVVLSRDDLVVHTIGPARMNGNNQVVYKLEFTTSAAIQSQKKRIYKSYKDTRNITDIVKDMCLAVGQTVNISDNLTMTLDKSFVSPGYTPIQAINFLAKRACASGDYFLFFERASTGKVFAGINQLRSLSENKTIAEISYHPAISYIEGVGAESILRTDVVETQNNFNHMINMNKGMYKSKLTTVDITRRSYETINFDYRDGHNDFYVNDLINDKSEFGSIDFDQSPGERMYIPAINDPVAGKTEWVRNDLHGALAVSGMRVRVNVSGAVSQLGAGDIIYLKVPSDASKSTNTESSLINENTMYSGKYFVTACRHVITPTTYAKQLELSRGSVRQTLVGNAPSVTPVSTSTPEQGYLNNVSKYINYDPTETDEEAGQTAAQRAEAARARYVVEIADPVVDVLVPSTARPIVGQYVYDGTYDYFLDNRINENVRRNIIQSQRYGQISTGTYSTTVNQQTQVRVKTQTSTNTGESTEYILKDIILEEVRINIR